MVNLVSSAKSGHEWNSNELHAYNIKFEFQDAQQFFEETTLPAPSVHQDILTALTGDDATDERSCNLLNDLYLAMMHGSPESLVRRFGEQLFKFLGYGRYPRHIYPRKELELLNRGERKCAIPDVCVFDMRTNDIFLLFQVDRAVIQTRMLNSLPRR
jgi:hypothetical protein